MQGKWLLSIVQPSVGGVMGILRRGSLADCLERYFPPKHIFFLYKSGNPIDSNLRFCREFEPWILAISRCVELGNPKT